ncbi:putative cyclin-D6-1 [Morus notabilis]|uniref:putative cyclin-D6-1 n=1 Tax=Morus notabilis TaxID=981085 RepID=UPI000CECFFFA|nr:putative cyclin-D6-1 [Morus notabilis]
MEFDLTDPLTLSFQEEHQSDTDIADLFASEADHMHSRNFFSRLKNSDSYVSFRSEAISLVLQAQFSCDFDPFISYLAINYMDRYLVSKQEIPQGKPWFSRLFIVACLSLAAKMKNFPFSLSDIQRDEEGFIFDAKTVHKMELLILDALSWRMRSITPFSFFAFFMSFFELNDHPLTQALKDRASEIIFSSQSDMKFSEFKPSVIAASALLSASHELFPLQFPSFNASISDCQYVKRENLIKCFNQMQEMVAMMQVYSSNCETFSSTKTPMSVLERNKLASSESENSSTVTSTTQCDTIISEKEDNKRRKLNGPCNRFNISKFCHY